MESLDCTDIKALLSGLIDDRLDPDSRHQAERHLAECKSCRELINQAEAAEVMVSASVAAHNDGGSLPQEFGANVLARTVYAERRAAHGHWVNWLGWMAAAAALALAVTVWVMDGRATVQAPPQIANNQLGSTLLSPDRSPDPSSFIELNALSRTPSVMRTSLIATTTPPALTDSAPAVSRDDIETIDDAARLIMMLAQAPDNSQVEVERIRRIAIYDLLLNRLTDLRANLAPRDRLAVVAAESVLYRIVRGPLNIADVHEMRDDVNQLDLADQLQAISDRLSPSSSL